MPAPQLSQRCGQLLLLLLALREIVSTLYGTSGGGLNLSSFYNANPQQILNIVAQEMAVAEKHETERNGRICKHVTTIMRNGTAVEGAIDRMDDFHNRGGGLDTLIKYQDDNTRNTMAKYKIAMHPNGVNGKPDLNQTLYGKDSYDYMQNHMRTTKDPRGGYFTKLPGGDYLSFDQSEANSHHLHSRDKKVHLEEPVLSKRWVAGMGPIGPTCDNLHKFGEGYEAKVSSF